jgi:preprotein translocase subunit SecA
LAEFAAAAAEQAQQNAEQGGVVTKERLAPPAPAGAGLRAKGIDDEAPQLTYSGPSEDGSAQVQRSKGGPKHAAPSGGTRRERREAARRDARAAKDRRG